jgi:hypothetical protein|nr:MAG TPA: hypothetical protein [Caudoviricetes sp.]
MAKLNKGDIVSIECVVKYQPTDEDNDNLMLEHCAGNTIFTKLDRVTMVQPAMSPGDAAMCKGQRCEIKAVLNAEAWIEFAPGRSEVVALKSLSRPVTVTAP